MDPQNKASGSYRWAAFAIVAAVFGWGLYLALGAALHESKDVRKSAVIMACTLAFLVFWLVFLYRPKSDPQAGNWNVASLYSFISSLLANGFVALVYFGMSYFSDLAQGRMLLAALVLAASSSVAVVVGLSRSGQLRGQRYAFAAIVLLVLAGIMGIVALRKSATNATRFASLNGPRIGTRISSEVPSALRAHLVHFQSARTSNPNAGSMRS